MVTKYLKKIMENIEFPDMEELKLEIDKAMQEINMEDIKKEFETEKMKMDEMLREIEKLELEKK